MASLQMEQVEWANSLRLLYQIALRPPQLLSQPWEDVAGIDDGSFLWLTEVMKQYYWCMYQKGSAMGLH